MTHENGRSHAPETGHDATETDDNLGSIVGQRVYDPNTLEFLGTVRQRRSGAFGGRRGALYIETPRGGQSAFFAGDYIIGSLASPRVATVGSDGKISQESNMTDDAFKRVSGAGSGAGGGGSGRTITDLETVAGQAALAEQAGRIEMDLLRARQDGDRETELLLLREAERIDEEAAAAGFQREVWMNAVNQAFQAEQEKLSRENQLRMQQASDLVRLQERAMGDAAESKRLLASLSGDPIRQAVALQGGVSVGTTPQAAFAGQLREQIGAPLPGAGINPYTAPMEEVGAAIGAATPGVPQAAAPAQPFIRAVGLAGGGAIDMTQGADGAFAINHDDSTPTTRGPTGIGILVGEGTDGTGTAPEVLEVQTDDAGNMTKLRVIPLALKSAGGVELSGSTLAAPSMGQGLLTNRAPLAMAAAAPTAKVSAPVLPSLPPPPPAAPVNPAKINPGDTTRPPPTAAFGEKPVSSPLLSPAPSAPTSGGSLLGGGGTSGGPQYTPQQTALIIMDEFERLGLDGQFAALVASAESGLNPYSPGDQPGYDGTFQLGPDHQRRFYAQGYTNIHDPRQQARYVANYVKQQNSWGEWYGAGRVIGMHNIRPLDGTQYTGPIYTNMSPVPYAEGYRPGGLTPPATVGGPSQPPPPASSGSNPTYTVRAGDTLSGIAARYPGVTVGQLVWANAGAYPSLAQNPNLIQVGWNLIIPTSANGAAGQQGGAALTTQRAATQGAPQSTGASLLAGRSAGFSVPGDTAHRSDKDNRRLVANVTRQMQRALAGHTMTLGGRHQGRINYDAYGWFIDLVAGGATQRIRIKPGQRISVLGANQYFDPYNVNTYPGYLIPEEGWGNATRGNVLRAAGGIELGGLNTSAGFNKPLPMLGAPPAKFTGQMAAAPQVQEMKQPAGLMAGSPQTPMLQGTAQTAGDLAIPSGPPVAQGVVSNYDADRFIRDTLNGWGLISANTGALSQASQQALQHGLSDVSQALQQLIAGLMTPDQAYNVLVRHARGQDEGLPTYRPEQIDFLRRAITHMYVIATGGGSTEFGTNPFPGGLLLEARELGLQDYLEIAGRNLPPQVALDAIKALLREYSAIPVDVPGPDDPPVDPTDPPVIPPVNDGIDPAAQIAWLNDLVDRWPNVSATDANLAQTYGLAEVGNIIFQFNAGNITQDQAYSQLLAILPGLRQPNESQFDAASIAQAINVLWQHMGFDRAPATEMDALGSPQFQNYVGQEARGVLDQMGFRPRLFRMSDTGQMFVVDGQGNAHAITDPGYASQSQLNLLFGAPTDDDPGIAAQALEINPDELGAFSNGISDPWLLNSQENIDRVLAEIGTEQGPFPTHKSIIRDTVTGMILPLPRYIGRLLDTIDPAVREIIYSVYQHSDNGYPGASLSRETRFYRPSGTYQPGSGSFLG